MLQLLTSKQTRLADAYTISSKQISSLQLMERASEAFTDAFEEEISDKNTKISFYCGTGNNGGDGLAIARILKKRGFENISVRIARFQKSESPDFVSNLRRLKDTKIPVTDILGNDSIPYEEADVIVDALLGSGLNKPLEGDLEQLVVHINQLHRTVIAVDIPTGLPAEGKIDTKSAMVKASLCISFQRPKINFFFPESELVLDRFKVVGIGLDEEFIQSQAGPWKLIEERDIRQGIKPRKVFSHKGSFGHALIVAGGKNTLGAALLCADACLHSGAGLTSASTPADGLTALNTYVPEVMFLDRKELLNSAISNKYSSIAIGPGLGSDQQSLEVLKHILEHSGCPMVIDADGLNILASNPELLTKLPSNCILTPHVKEFDRLFGKSECWWDRINLAIKKAQELDVVIVLKNRYTFIFCTQGNIFINPTGNPAMAVGGTGDVLTGMISAFQAQGYNAEEASILAIYLHGAAGDSLKEMNSIPPRYIIEKLPFLIGSLSASRS